VDAARDTVLRGVVSDLAAGAAAMSSSSEWANGGRARVGASAEAHAQQRSNCAGVVAGASGAGSRAYAASSKVALMGMAAAKFNVA